MMIRTLRWLLVVPMASVGWFIAFTGFLALHGLIFEFCPVEYQISGMCTHSWAIFAEDVLLLAGAFVSAVFVVSFATRTAPAFKSQTAAVTYLAGLAVAVWAYLETDLLGAFVAAAIGGAITVVLVYKKNGWRQASRYRQYELFI